MLPLNWKRLLMIFWIGFVGSTATTLHERINYNIYIMTLKLRAVGTSTGLILPKELLAQLGWKEGEEVIATSTRDGLVLSVFDPEVAEEIEIGKGIMRRYRNTFRELAK